MALCSVFNAEEDDDYAMDGKLDAQRTYLSLHCIFDPLIKLLVKCMFNTALVDDIGVNSPTVDAKPCGRVITRTTKQSWVKSKFT